MSAPKDLYERSRRAATRYFVKFPKPKRDNPWAKAQRAAEFETFRTGWMIGWRAGNKAKKS